MALAFWHFPEWERVCQRRKKLHHNFSSVHIFSISHKKPLSVLTSLVSSHVHSQPEQILLQYFGWRYIFPNYIYEKQGSGPSASSPLPSCPGFKEDAGLWVHVKTPHDLWAHVKKPPLTDLWMGRRIESWADGHVPRTEEVSRYLSKTSQAISSS